MEEEIGGGRGEEGREIREGFVGERGMDVLDGGDNVRWIGEEEDNEKGKKRWEGERLWDVRDEEENGWGNRNGVVGGY